MHAAPAVVVPRGFVQGCVGRSVVVVERSMVDTHRLLRLLGVVGVHPSYPWAVAGMVEAPCQKLVALQKVEKQ